MKVNKKHLIIVLILSLLLSVRNVYAIDEEQTYSIDDFTVTETGEENNNSSDISNYSYNYQPYDKEDIKYEENEGINYYKNEKTGFVAFIDDGQDLITTEQEKQLLERLKTLTEYGNAGFVTMRTSYSSFRGLCQDYYRQRYGTQNGSLFVIEMSTRQLGLYSDGANQHIITSSKANSITDNVYRYASNGDYYGCADLAFSQMYTVLNGGKIAEPMRYTSNIFIALTLALFFGFVFVMVKSKIKKATYREIVKNCNISFEIGETSAVKTGQHSVYSPQSSGSSGSSGGGGGGGGGGSFGSHGF